MDVVTDIGLWTAAGEGAPSPINPSSGRPATEVEARRRHAPGEHGMPDEQNPSPELGTESICGTNDMQRVEQYDGTLGVSQAFVAHNEGPVGNTQWNADLASIYDNPGNVANARFCTGTLISEDLFITAAHCFEPGGSWVFPMADDGSTIGPAEVARNMHVDFNFQHDPDGNLRPPVTSAITELVEFRPGGLDVAIVRLAGRPGRRFGWAFLSETDPAIGEMLCIIQHPSGLPKRIEAGPLTGIGMSGNNDYLRYNSLDTQGGSSGSGVLASDGLVKGIHTNAGCDADPSPDEGNHGLRIEIIGSNSRLVRSVSHIPYTMSSVATPHWVRSEVEDDQTLYTLTGTAVVHLGGTGSAWRRTRIWLPVPIPGLGAANGLRIKHWAPKVSLAAIGNRNKSVNEGWAVDGFALAFAKDRPVDTVNLRTWVAVRDSDGALLRFNYRITLVGEVEAA